MIFLKTLIFITLAFSHPNADFEKSIKTRLEQEILNNYVPDLEAILGLCEGEECLSDRGDHLRLKTTEKEICLPYTQCGFYKCMEEKYECSDVGVNYFTKLAFPTCSKYVENIQKNYFTKKGIEWIYSVMTCLQTGLIDECEVDGKCNQGSKKKNCSYITKFTLDFHPSCYINSGVGVCKLPLKDKYNIWRTVNKFMTKDERAQAYKVIFECVMPF